MNHQRLLGCKTRTEATHTQSPKKTAITSCVLENTIGGISGLDSAKWLSIHQIQCATPGGIDSASVIVTTRTGGVGSSTLQFKYVKEDEVEDLSKPIGMKDEP